ncbi:MAG: AAA family ATPase [Verrucomicrobiales bacterium]|jgi:predicted ATP-binding protein involved in virulence|nr:AAA family ATPase [Verrucomicrobiales bacterium]
MLELTQPDSQKTETSQQDIFIQEIKIQDVRNIKNFSIPLSQSERTHLIITGKNGSGKTSVLNALEWKLENPAAYRNLTNLFISLEREKIHENIKGYEEAITISISREREKIHEKIKRYEKEKNRQMENNQPYFVSLAEQNILKSIKEMLGIGIKINFNLPPFEKLNKGDFILASFLAKRNINLRTPEGVKKVETSQSYKIESNIGQQFIQHLVNLRVNKSLARDDNDSATAQKIDQWFENFEKSLVKIFNTEKFKLEFDKKNYNFYIVEGNKEPYSLNQLSDGFSSFLNIITDLMMRMEGKCENFYDLQGVVLIDEIETHLHVELQKQIMPFLISFFPRIQFIVTTHSPFVLNSIKNAVICDLEKRIVVGNFSAYSYDSIIENYFDTDKYSTILKDEIEEYEKLSTQSMLTKDEQIRLEELDKKFYDKIDSFPPELVVKIQQIKLTRLTTQKGQ